MTASAVPKAARRARRRRFSLTREGRVFVLVTLGVGVAAVNTANNLLFLVLGLLLSMLLTSGVLSDLVLARLYVERLPSGRVFAGSPAYFTLRVHNAKPRLRAISFEVVDHPEQGPEAHGYVLDLAAGERRDVVVTHVFPRRGRVTLERVEARTRYPFDLIDKGDATPAPVEIVVFPRLLETTPALSAANLEGELVLRATDRGADVVGLREIVAGEHVRDVHAGRSAALGRLVRRERASEGARVVDVEIDTYVPAGDAEASARFEDAISAAATVVLRRAEVGDVVTVRAARSGRVLARAAAPTQIDAALTALALLAPDADTEARA